MVENFIKNFDIREVNAPVSAANNTDDNSDIIDMSGYEGVVFIVPITDSVSGGVATLTLEANTANSNTGMVATNAVATATSADNDDLNDTLLVAELHKPTKRYVQAVITSATQNIAFGSTIAILYGPKKGPISEHASVQASDLAAGL